MVVEGVVYNNKGVPTGYTGKGGSNPTSSHLQVKAVIKTEVTNPKYVSPDNPEGKAINVYNPNTGEVTVTPYSYVGSGGQSILSIASGSNVMTPSSSYIKQVSKIDSKGSAGFEDTVAQTSFYGNVNNVKNQESSYQAQKIISTQNQLKDSSQIIIPEAKRFGKTETMSSSGNYVSQQEKFGEFKPVVTSNKIRDVTGLTSINSFLAKKSEQVKSYEENLPKNNKGISNVVDVIGFPIVYGLVRGSENIVNVASHPVESTKEAFTFIVPFTEFVLSSPNSPKKEAFMIQASSFSEETAENPIGVATDIISLGFLFHKVGKVTENVKVNPEFMSKSGLKDVIVDVKTNVDFFKAVVGKEKSPLVSDHFVIIKPESRSYVKTGTSYVREAMPIIDLTKKVINEKVSNVKNNIVDSFKPITEPIKEVSQPLINDLNEASIYAYSDFINPIINEVSDIKQRFILGFEEGQVNSPFIYETQGMKRTKQFQQDILNKEQNYRSIIMDSPISLSKKRKVIVEGNPLYVKEILVKVRVASSESRNKLPNVDLSLGDKKDLVIYDINKKYSIAKNQHKIKDIFVSGEGYKGFSESGVTVSEPTGFSGEVINKELKITGRTALEGKPKLSEDFLSLDSYNLNADKYVGVKRYYPEVTIAETKRIIPSGEFTITSRTIPSKTVEFNRRLPKLIVSSKKVVKKNFNVFEGDENINVNIIAELKPSERHKVNEDLSDEFLTKNDKSNVNTILESKNVQNVLSIEKVDVEPVVSSEKVSDSSLVGVSISRQNNVLSTNRLVSFNPSIFVSEEQVSRPIIDISNIRSGRVVSIMSVGRIQDRVPIIDIKSVQDDDVVLDVNRVQDSLPMLDLGLVQGQEQVQEQILEQKQENIFDRFNNRNYNDKFYSKNKTDEVKVLDFFSKKDSISKRSSKFKLLVRKKGKFQERREGLDVASLFQQGVNIVKGGAEASFKIINESGSIVTPILNTSEFKESKRDKGVLVQQRSFRISSVGEKLDITYKGIEANKSRGVSFGL